MIFVNQDPPESIDNIYLPLDFSNYSELSLEMAKNISSKNGADLTCQHFFKVPQRVLAQGSKIPYSAFNAEIDASTWK